MACEADAYGREHLIDGVSTKPEREYPQKERAMAYFREYIEAEKILVDWMDNYELGKGCKPKSELIVKMRSELKKAALAKLKKKLDAELAEKGGYTAKC